jgi:cytidylate kinase
VKGWNLVLLALLLPLTGCREDLLPRARDITRVELMQVLALDEGEEGKLRVTAASGVRSGGQGGEPRPPAVLTREAPTVLGACMDMQGSARGYASFSHVEQVILSAGAAQRSTAGLLDFLGRDPEMRLDAHIYITEGEASDVVEKVKKEERSAAELLEALSREMEVRSQAWPVTVRELLIDLEENGCALLPVVEVKEEGGQPVLVCQTMGWFREDDFQQALSPEEARGTALLKGELGSGAVEAKLPEIGLELRYEDGVQKMILNGEDVSREIRTEQASANASKVSAMPAVRAFLLDTQRDLARKCSVIMDGRDIGTVILPNADLKIFLTASPEARAQRRYLEQIAKGMDVTYEQVLEGMRVRDLQDSTRAVAPLKPADDAVIMDTTGYRLEESIKKLIAIVKERLGV